MSVYDPGFNGLNFMAHNFDVQQPGEVTSQGAENAATLVVNQALSAASSAAGLMQFLRDAELAKARLHKKLEEARSTNAQLRLNVETIAKWAEVALT